MSRAPENIAAASSRAPPKRLPMVKRPEAREEMRSLPARVATMVFMALQKNQSQHTGHYGRWACAYPETAGPWSAVSMRTISMNLVAHGGRRLLNHSKLTTPPRPMSSLKTSEIRIPA